MQVCQEVLDRMPAGSERQIFVRSTFRDVQVQQLPKEFYVCSSPPLQGAFIQGLTASQFPQNALL